MKLIEKLKPFLVLLLILSFSTSAIAQPGRYIQLEKDASIPWDGWCFDVEAMAIILAAEEVEERKCLLRLEEAREKQSADFDLRYGKLLARLDYETNTKQATIDALSKENSKLEQTIIHNDKYGWLTPSLIGAATGALIVILIGTFSDVK